MTVPNLNNALPTRPLAYEKNSSAYTTIEKPRRLNLLFRFGERSALDLLLQPSSSFFTQANVNPENCSQKYYSQAHLDAATSWLERCHDSTDNDGVSWGFSLKGGWRDSYRETSGYIANTFFDLARQQQDEAARERAIAISHWLLTVQEADGAIANTRYGKGGIVFDTGQVLQGLIRAYTEVKDSVFLDSANRAGQWLVRSADEAGLWTRNTHNEIPHVYNSRVAWKLVKLHTVSPDAEFERVARANLDWAVSQQQSSGLFEQCAFTPEAAPFVHTIAYAIRGLLEAGQLLNDSTYTESAIAGARAVQKLVAEDGFIPGQINVDGTSAAGYCCLTGNCQMAIIWLQLFKMTGEMDFYIAAGKSLRYVMDTQDIAIEDPNIRGAVKGSQPIWGRYTRLSYPGWATKFFIDGLLLLGQVENEMS